MLDIFSTTYSTFFSILFDLICFFVIGFCLLFYFLFIFICIFTSKFSTSFPRRSTARPGSQNMTWKIARNCQEYTTFLYAFHLLICLFIYFYCLFVCLLEEHESLELFKYFLMICFISMSVWVSFEHTIAFFFFLFFLFATIKHKTQPIKEMEQCYRRVTVSLHTEFHIRNTLRVTLRM